jgi:uncharacterized protein YbcI
LPGPIAYGNLRAVAVDSGVAQQQQSLRSNISNGIVGLLKEYYGKGPDKAKTYHHDDLVVVLLRGGFTPVEQTLLDAGRGEAVIQQRMAFQEVMRRRFSEIIEDQTGRRVVAFMSGSHQEPDVVAELFLLEHSDMARS